MLYSKAMRRNRSTWPDHGEIKRNNSSCSHLGSAPVTPMCDPVGLKNSHLSILWVRMQGDEALVFSVRYADVKLKISLDAKWQARSLQQAVVVPFVKAFNKKHPSSSVSENGLLGILADGAAWLDSTQTAAAVPASTTVVELFFGSKDELQIRQCRVRYGDVALKIEMDEKWLRQPFAQAVLVPFTIAYNKKPVPSALRVEDFSGADVDGDQLKGLAIRVIHVVV